MTMRSYSAIALKIHYKTLGVLERFLDVNEEGDGLASANQAVVVGEREIHHRSRYDRAVTHDRALLDPVHAEDARLRRVQDRSREQGAVDAAIGNGERAALQLFERKLAAAGADAEIGHRRLDLGETHAIGVVQHRNDKAALGADGNADVIVVFVDDVLAVDLGIDGRNILQGLHGRLDEESHEAKLDPVPLLEGVPVIASQLHDRAHVRFVEGGEHGGGVLSLFEALG